MVASFLILPPAFTAAGPPLAIQLGDRAFANHFIALRQDHEADGLGDRVGLADGPVRAHTSAGAWVSESVGVGEALGVGELLPVGAGSSEGVAEVGVDQVVVDQSGEGQPDQDGPGKIICGSWATATCSVLPPGWRDASGMTGAAV